MRHIAAAAASRNSDVRGDSLGDIVRDARMRVCEAYADDGAEAALEAVALAALDLALLVAEGALVQWCAWDALQEVSENLGLVRVFGQDTVQLAIAFGPTTYAAQIRAASALTRVA